jgi:hypothetical protein
VSRSLKFPGWLPAVMMDSMTDRARPQPSTGPDRDSVLPRTTRDETAEGWGESPERLDSDFDSDSASESDSDAERYLRERPPHHEG